MTFSDATSMIQSAPGEWVGAIPARWDVAGNANGGYLLALIGRAMADSAGLPDVVSIGAHYLRPGLLGPVRAETEIVKQGRQFTTVRATLAAEKPIITALGTFSDHTATNDERSMVLMEPPEFPEPGECIPILPSEEGFPPALMAQVDCRLHPEDNFYEGTSGNLRMRGWLKLKDDEPWDSIGLLLASDTFPPTIFNSTFGMAWVPTLELTVHIRHRPVPGWLKCDFSSRFVTGGFVEEDGLMWDETGKLVAQSRQISLLPRS